MQEREVDIAIIGAGSAGLSAWHAALQQGPAIIERGMKCGSGD